MNILEKILEEIKEKCVELSKSHWGDDECHLVGKGIQSMYIQTEKIIRSHMDGATDTDMGDKDDTEEKIREHIAECLHRIDNIRSFIGSKEYTSNDEKCIRNIEVLKTSITALEEYLSSKKKNGNNGWIPVEDGLPEEHDSIFAKFKGTGMWSNAMFEKSSDKVNATFEFEDGTRKSGTSYTIDGKWECEKGNCAVKRKVVAWRPLPEPYKPKKLQTEEKPVQ